MTQPRCAVQTFFFLMPSRYIRSCLEPRMCFRVICFGVGYSLPELSQIRYAASSLERHVVDGNSAGRIVGGHGMGRRWKIKREKDREKEKKQVKRGITCVMEKWKRRDVDVMTEHFMARRIQDLTARTILYTRCRIPLRLFRSPIFSPYFFYIASRIFRLHSELGLFLLWDIFRISKGFLLSDRILRNERNFRVSPGDNRRRMNLRLIFFSRRR